MSSDELHSTIYFILQLLVAFLGTNLHLDGLFILPEKLELAAEAFVLGSVFSCNFIIQ